MIKLSEIEHKRKQLLDTFRFQQSFRVAIGKSTWIEYQEFNPDYNLREILDNEIVIEFDTDSDTSWIATNETAINLYNAGYSFEIWEHKGRSPHIHIHDLPITTLTPQARAMFKKLFIRKYTPQEYIRWVDLSLTGIHLVRLEYSSCWKGKYGIKELVYSFNPKQDSL